MLGVEVRLGHGVDQIDEDGVIIAGERIPSKSVIWTAGVAASPAGKWLDVETDSVGQGVDTKKPHGAWPSADSSYRRYRVT